MLGSISAALSSPVFVPSGKSVGSFSRTAAGNRAYKSVPCNDPCNFYIPLVVSLFWLEKKNREQISNQ